MRIGYYLHKAVEELNLGLPRTNPDFKSRALNHFATLPLVNKQKFELSTLHKLYKSFTLS